MKWTFWLVKNKNASTNKPLECHMQASTFIWHLKMSKWYNWHDLGSYANFYNTKNTIFRWGKGLLWETFSVNCICYDFLLSFLYCPKAQFTEELVTGLLKQKFVPIRQLNIWWTRFRLWIAVRNRLSCHSGMQSQHNNSSELWQCQGRTCSWSEVCFSD